MEIAHDFIRVYSQEEREYSISYQLIFDDFFSSDLKKRPLYLTPNGILINDFRKPVYHEDEEGETIMKLIAVECEPFSVDKYLEIINGHIARLFLSVGLHVQNVSKVDEITYITFGCGGLDAEKYRGHLLKLLSATIQEKGTVYKIQKIEEYVMETIRAMCNERGNDVISISKESFMRNDLFNTTRPCCSIDTQDESIYTNSFIPEMEMDHIYLCRVYRGEDIFKLILFRLYLQRRIVDFYFVGSGEVRVKMSIEEEYEFRLRYSFFQKTLYINDIEINLKRSVKINDILDVLICKIKPTDKIDFDELEEYIDPNYLDGICDDKIKMTKLNKAYVNSFEQLNRTIKINLSIKENIFITSSTSVQMNPSLSIKFLS